MAKHKHNSSDMTHELLLGFAHIAGWLLENYVQIKDVMKNTEQKIESGKVNSESLESMISSNIQNLVGEKNYTRVKNLYNAYNDVINTK
jgi:hypothetical protein